MGTARRPPSFTRRLETVDHNRERERSGHDSPREDSIEMLCLPLRCSNPGKGCRRNQDE